MKLDRSAIVRRRVGWKEHGEPVVRWWWTSVFMTLRQRQRQQRQGRRAESQLERGADTSDASRAWLRADSIGHVRSYLGTYEF